MVRSLAYFNALFITGYVPTQQDYVDLGDTFTNIKVILGASNSVLDDTIITSDTGNTRMQYGVDAITFWGLINLNNLSNSGEKPVVVDNDGFLKTSTILQYKALLSQSSFFPPQIVSNGDGTPFINDLSAAIVFSRASQGIYWGTLAGAFPDGKTFLSITSRGSGTFFSIQRIDDDTIEIATADSVEPLDSILNKTSILIEIYP